MQSFKRLLVGLDLTAMDDVLIRYAATWKDLTGTEKIYFVHVERDLYWPEEIMQDLPSKGRPLDESLIATIQTKVRAVFGDQQEVETVCEVIEGSPLAQLTHWAKIKKIDLILVGKKHSLKGTGVVPHKLARTSRTSILFVPEKVPEKLRRILVPIDFSDYSREALQQALHIAAQVPGVEVLAQHVYAVPFGYYKSGYNQTEFKQRLFEIAQEQFKAFIAKIPSLEVPVEPVYTCDEEDDMPASICRKAVAENTDLLIIGAKGHSALSVFLLGSVTEKLLRHYINVPVLVVKKPDEELGFLDTVMLE
jgi:nucleotide-binding universal stress UspA family protein